MTDKTTRKAVDYQKLPITALEAATAFPRQEILRWHKENGLPRNRDGTYNLREFIRWHAAFEVSKAAPVPTPLRVDPLREQKTRLARIEADRAEGRLIDRTLLIKILVTRALRTVQLFSEPKAKEWSAQHEGKTAAQLEPDYMAAFRAVRLEWLKFPEALEDLIPPPAKAKLEEALALLP